MTRDERRAHQRLLARLYRYTLDIEAGYFTQALVRSYMSRNPTDVDDPAQLGRDIREALGISNDATNDEIKRELHERFGV